MGSILAAIRSLARELGRAPGFLLITVLTGTSEGYSRRSGCTSGTSSSPAAAIRFRKASTSSA